MTDRDISWSSPISLTKTQHNAPSALIPAPQIPLGTLGPAPWLLTRWTVTQSRSTLALKAKKFVELVEAGETVTEAAREVGEDIRTIRAVKDKHGFGLQVQALLDSHGWMTPEVKKAWVRASQTKILDSAMDAVAADPTDAKMLKVALDASKVIGEDTEVNLFQNKAAVPPPAFPTLPAGLASLIGGVVEVAEQPAVEKVPEGEQ